MRKILLSCCSLFLFFLISCQKENTVEPELIVEAWIEKGEPPIILLHNSLTFAEDIENLEDVARKKIIYFGKVTLNDGENEIILTGKLDNAFFPPYKYSTSHIIGEEGKHYNLKVEYNGKVATAETSIPYNSASLDSITVKQKNNSESMELRAYITNKNIQNKKYCLFYKYHGNYQYFVCFLGVFNSSKIKDGIIEIPINKKKTLFDQSKEEKSIFFQKGDTLSIKLSCLDDTSYSFWDTYSSNSISAGLPFFQNYNNVMSNIIGGKGYWCGYNSSIYNLILDRDSVYKW